MEFKLAESDAIIEELKRLIPINGYQLETMPGINFVSAANIIAEVGNIERFPTSDNLARFAGICPVILTKYTKNG